MLPFDFTPLLLALKAIWDAPDTDVWQAGLVVDLH